MAELDEIIQQINEEILNEKDTLIRRIINEEMRTFKFNESNVSSNIIAMLMAARDIQVPLPERKEIPAGIEEAADEGLSFVNINASSIFTDLLAGNNVYLYGRAGTGKTFLAKKIAEDLLGRRTGIINCNLFTSPTNIVGGITMEGYMQGVLSECWEKGYILILDELPKLDPNTAGLLNEALAQSADTESTVQLSKEKYDSFKKQLDAADKYVGFELKEENGKYYKTTHVTITDGKGDKIRKNPNFGVIATGNTDLKTMSTNFSGNNRQDYSLVDRFAGSFYKIDYDVTLEKALIYSQVREVSYELRQFLDLDPNSVESISLRTMLNFNRIYEQEYLRKIKSPLANPAIKIDGKVEAKTFLMSVESFVNTLPASKISDLYTTTNLMQLASADTPIPVFIAEFKDIHKVDPITMKPIS
jgi:cobaltochelatase CobS